MLEFPLSLCYIPMHNLCTLLVDEVVPKYHFNHLTSLNIKAAYTNVHPVSLKFAACHFKK